MHHWTNDVLNDIVCRILPAQEEPTEWDRRAQCRVHSKTSRQQEHVINTCADCKTEHKQTQALAALGCHFPDQPPPDIENTKTNWDRWPKCYQHNKNSRQHMQAIDQCDSCTRNHSLWLKDEDKNIKLATRRERRQRQRRKRRCAEDAAQDAKHKAKVVEFSLPYTLRDPAEQVLLDTIVLLAHPLHI